MVGDEVVARRNDRRLHDPDGHGFVKNGSTGTIIDIDHDRREVVVAFEREGTIRIPNAYLAAGPARTRLRAHDLRRPRRNP